MHLTGKKKARLVYVLLNTPDELTYEDKKDYSALDKKYKIKTFAINYDESVITDLQNRVTNIREYLKTLNY